MDLLPPPLVRRRRRLSNWNVTHHHPVVIHPHVVVERAFAPHERPVVSIGGVTTYPHGYYYESRLFKYPRVGYLIYKFTHVHGPGRPGRVSWNSI